MAKKRPTSFDVAKLAGVSRTTVSFVLNNIAEESIPEKTRQRVFEAAKQLDYHPDSAGQKLASGKTKMIGLVLKQSTEQVYMDAFLLSVLIGIEKNASRTGYHVLLKHIALDSEEKYSRLFAENHVDGIIVSGPLEEDQELLEMHQNGVPIMLLGQMPDTDIPFVDVDAEMGAEMGVDYLISKGFSKIAMVSNAPMKYTSAQIRKKGYLNALQKAGLPINEDWIKEGDFTPAGGYKAMKELLSLKSIPSAVFVASDVVAMGVYSAINDHGLHIPDDIAILGFDDIPTAKYFNPPLSTIRLPGFNLGWAAGDRLIRLISGEGLDTQGYLLKTEIIIREST